MNKKLMAVAIAGALAAPGFAFAQSAVTISGIFKVGYGQYKMGNSLNRANNSQDMVVDNSSRIIFGVTEDLGNGLAAVGQLDVRFQPDNSAAFNGSGNDFVGLKSKTWGALTLGRYDLHYGRLADETASKAGALHAAAISLMDYMPTNTGANTSIANGTRTPNVVRYDTPNWNGFSAIVAYSSDPINGVENDMTVLGAPGAATNPGSKSGSGWNFNPVYENGPMKLGYSYWDAKADAPVASTLYQRGDTVYGSYQWGGFKVGLGWNRSKLTGAISGTKVSERDAWSLPMMYNWGPHTIGGHYTKANDIKSNIASAAGYGNTGADMIAIFYNYDFSKRTAVGLTYAKINNDSGAAYAFFTGTGSLGSPNLVPQLGEKPQLVQAVIRHAF